MHEANDWVVVAGLLWVLEVMNLYLFIDYMRTILPLKNYLQELCSCHYESSCLDSIHQILLSFLDELHVLTNFQIPSLS